MAELLHKSWDIESDIVVVGYGAGGCAAAVTAHDNGASVVILEKMPSGGGNTRVSGANIIIPKDKGYLQYVEALNFGATERDILETFVNGALKLGDWFREMGGEMVIFSPLDVGYPETSHGASFPQVEGAKSVVKYAIKTTGEAAPPGERMWRFLSGLVEKRGIKVLTSTPAKELIRSEGGKIVGVEAEREGKHIFIKANKAVILTCGGFENNPALKLEHLAIKQQVGFLGSPGNTGDGLKMVQKIGGDLWHLGSLSCLIGFQAPEYEAAFFPGFLDVGFIFTDKHGKRFANELKIEVHDYGRYTSYFDVERMEFPRVPLWGIFDEQTRRRGAISRSTAGYNKDLYKWSADNSAEIKKGWILQGKTANELARHMGVEVSTFEDTITRYNEYCRTGRDADFDRAKVGLRVLAPPFYAIQLWPALVNTQGGPRRDKESRVLDPDGKPIPGLYAAGELGSIWGYLYQGGGNVSEAIIFGCIAARSAVRESPSL